MTMPAIMSRLTTANVTRNASIATYSSGRERLHLSSLQLYPLSVLCSTSRTISLVTSRPTPTSCLTARSRYENHIFYTDVGCVSLHFCSSLAVHTLPEHHGFLVHGKELSSHVMAHSPSLHPHDPTNEDLCHHLLFPYVFIE